MSKTYAEGRSPRGANLLTLLLLLAIIAAVPAWASIIPCPANPTTDLLNPTFSGSVTGCTAGNVQFVNFSVTTGTTGTINGVTLAPENWANPPSATTIGLTTATGDPNSISFNTPGQTCTSNTATNGTFCVQGAPASLVVSITYLEQATSPSNLITQIGLTAAMASHSSGSGGADAVVFLEYCPGVTTFSQGCAGYGVFQIGIVNGHNITLTGSDGASLAGVTTVAVRDTIFLSTQNGQGSFADITDFGGNTLVPEPATLGMVGGALLGLGAFRFRRRKPLA